MATHSSIFAQEIQRTEEPGELVYGVTKSPTQLSTHNFLHAFTPEETVKESQVWKVRLDLWQAQTAIKKQTSFCQQRSV